MRVDDESSDSFQRVRQLFEAALDLPAEERAMFLDRECGADGEVRREIDELFACDADGSDLGSLLDRGVELITNCGRSLGHGGLPVGGWLVAASPLAGESVRSHCVRCSVAAAWARSTRLSKMNRAAGLR